MCVIQVSLVIVVKDIVRLTNSFEFDLGSGALVLRYFIRVARKRCLIVL